MLEPDGLIPHTLTQKQAIEKLFFWVDLHEIKPERKVDIPRPIYLPLWTFDLGGGINYSGETIQTETDDFRQEQRVVRINDQYPVLVNDFPVPASHRTAHLVTRILPTFDLSRIKSYDPRFIADWPAEIHDIAMSDASLEARGEIAGRTLERVRSEYSHLKKFRASSAGMTVESFKLILLPVWITEIHYHGETHTILINGQNGRVVGDTPL